MKHGIIISAVVILTVNQQLFAQGSWSPLTGGNFWSTNTGSIGINTTTPAVAYKLDVNGQVRVNGILALRGTQTAQNLILANEDADNSGLIIRAGNGANLLFSQIEVTGNWNGTAAVGGKLAFSTTGVERMRITNTGSIGIGTSTPNTNAQMEIAGNIFAGGKVIIGLTGLSAVDYNNKINSASMPYSLAVNGNAIFNRVRVKLYANWPDYVFDENYHLLPIEQLERFIKKEKHLPNITPAAEAEKDGIDIATTQRQLLQKIEELTLYIIEQNKRIDRLEKEAENNRNK